MNDENREKYPSEAAERFQIRLTPGLRDRIKAYAERHGRSMNTEIIRVLEREFPEQWPLGSRLDDLAKRLSILAAGKGDPRVEQFLADFEETVAGIITGRVTGVDGETRDAIESVWNDYEFREQEAAADAYEPAYEEEEERAMEVVGRPEKYAEPRQAPPQPIADQLQLMEIMPKYDLERLTERLAEADIEGAKAVLDKVEKAKLEQKIRLAAEAAEEKRRRDELFFKGDPFWAEPK